MKKHLKDYLGKIASGKWQGEQSQFAVGEVLGEDRTGDYFLIGCDYKTRLAFTIDPVPSKDNEIFRDYFVNVGDMGRFRYFTWVLKESLTVIGSKEDLKLKDYPSYWNF